MTPQSSSPPPSREAVSVEDFDRLVLVLGGHIFFQTLSAAVEFDLFSLLAKEGPLTLPAITRRLGISAEKPVRILLLGCTALGLLRKEGGAYRNSPSAQQFLNRASPGNLIDIVKWQHFINYRPMYHFHDAIRANDNVGLEKEFEGPGKTLYERLARVPHLEKIFQDAMKGISVQANATLAAEVDFSHVKRLVDVGGGNGSNIMTLARKYPALKASVFDSPTVCEIARKNIADNGLSNRCDAVPGDCFKDPFPKGADCILFAHFFTIWSEEKNQLLLRKCFEALPSGGTVVLFQMLQHDDETGPLTAAMGSPYFLTLATGEGMLYTGAEYETWMRAAGFASVKTQRLPLDHGAVIGKKA
jgi:ubiquinone/menaquinone biosynthesis C-methylase UbiE